jgi:hypothetical protein
VTAQTSNLSCAPAPETSSRPVPVRSVIQIALVAVIGERLKNLFAKEARICTLWRCQVLKKGGDGF